MPIIDISNIITESVKSDKDELINRAAIFYEHILKWKYQKEIQYDSWIQSIVEQSISISNKIYGPNKNKRYTNVINRANNEIINAYNIGLNAAIKKSKIDEIKNDNEVFYTFNTIESLTEFDFIIDWMYKYASKQGFKYLLSNSRIREKYNGQYRSEWFY